MLFTSGATGPAKGVRLPAPPAARPAATLVAHATASRPATGSSPRSRRSRCYGPALGVASAVPDIDVTAPGTLTAAALADAARRDRRRRWCSPRRPRCANVVATAGDAHADAARGAGPGAAADVAPARRSRSRAAAAAAGAAAGRRAAHAVRDDRGAAGDRHLARRRSRPPAPGDGVCVGRPLPGVEVAAQPAGRRRATPTGALTDRTGRHRRDLRRAAAREGPLRRAVGHRAGAAPRDRRLAPHRRRRAPRRRRPAVGRGPAGRTWSAPPTGR